MADYNWDLNLKRYLNKKTGKMLPDRALMYCAAIEDSEFVGEKQNFW
jgi:hypothetical protein